LSVFLQFGIVSIREVFRRALRQAKDRGVQGIMYHAESQTVTMDRKIYKDSYISELAWREFWHHIMYYFPLTAQEEFQAKRRHIQWSRDTQLLQAWKA
jgi:deoxyribodipyrimidine photo-lyase